MILQVSLANSGFRIPPGSRGGAAAHSLQPSDGMNGAIGQERAGAASAAVPVHKIKTPGGLLDFGSTWGYGFGCETKPSEDFIRHCAAESNTWFCVGH